MIMQEIKKQKEAIKEKAKENPSYHPTRRDVRANRELQKLKDKINLAGNTNFDELASETMSNNDMEESMMGFVGQMTPTKRGLNEQDTTKRFMYKEDGTKQRLK